MASPFQAVSLAHQQSKISLLVQLIQLTPEKFLNPTAIVYELQLDLLPPNNPIDLDRRIREVSLIHFPDIGRHDGVHVRNHA